MHGKYIDYRKENKKNDRADVNFIICKGKMTSILNPKLKPKKKKDANLKLKILITPILN